MKCDDILIESLEWCHGEPKLPGIRQGVFFIPKKDIAKWPILKKKGVNPSDDVTYEGDFVLRAEKKWGRIDVIVDKSPVTSEPQGEVPSVTTLNKATFKHPDVGMAATSFVRKANNTDLVFLIQDKLGRFRVLGNEMFNTITKASSSLGGAVTDESGTTIEVEVTDLCPAPFYVGQIETEEGIINETVKPDPGKE